MAPLLFSGYFVILLLPFSNFLSTFPRPFPVVNTDEQPNPGIFQHIGNVCPERSRTGAASRRRPTPDSHSALRNHSLSSNFAPRYPRGPATAGSLIPFAPFRLLLF